MSGPTQHAKGKETAARNGSGRLSFFVLLVSQLVATAGFMFVVPFLPLYVQRLGVEDAGDAAAWAGVLNAASALTMAVAAPMWGRLGDRFGQKKMLLRATFAGAVMLGLMGLVTGPWQLLVLRLLQGSLTGTVAAATVLVSATAPQEKASSRLGSLQMVLFAAAGAGPFVGGVFADLVGIRASFGVTAALLATSGVLVLFGVQEGDRPGREPSPEKEAKDSSGEPLPFRKLMPGVVALFVANVAITGVSPALPGFLEGLRGSSAGVASLAGQILGVGAVSASLGSLVGGRIAARLSGATPLMVGAMLLSGLAFLPQANAGSVAALWALYATASFFLGVVIPVANLSVRGSVGPERQGAAFGVAASANSAAFGTGPLVGGLLASSIGFGAPFLVPGILLIGAAALLTMLPVLVRPRRYGKLLKLALAGLVGR